jgi:hypothetical protein
VSFTNSITEPIYIFKPPLRGTSSPINPTWIIALPKDVDIHQFLEDKFWHGPWTKKGGNAVVILKNYEQYFSRIHWFEDPKGNRVEIKLKKHFRRI